MTKKKKKLREFCTYKISHTKRKKIKKPLKNIEKNEIYYALKVKKNTNELLKKMKENQDTLKVQENQLLKLIESTKQKIIEIRKKQLRTQGAIFALKEILKMEKEENNV